MSTGTATTPLIAAFAGDLSTGPAGKVHFKSFGTAPNRTLVVEFLNMSLLYQSTLTNDGTYQVRIYESTGIVEFVYGAMSRNAGTAAFNSQQVGIGFAAGNTAGTLSYVISATNANTNTSATFTQQTYTAGSGAIANLNSAADGVRRVYTFVPPQTAPVAPGTLTFTLITYSSTRLNWVDNSTNELGFAVYISTDNLTFSYLGTVTSTSVATTGTAYGINITGLTAGTTYYYQIASYTEGVSSAPALSGSQTTLAAVVFNNSPYTIDNTLATGGTNFNNFTDAITALNSGVVSGAVVFNVTAGQTFNEAPPAITKLGSAGNLITFQKTSGANPTILAPATGVGAGDYIIGLFGADYIVFDGISLSDAGNAAASEVVHLGWTV